MRQLKTHLMLFTWFPELLPVYCPLLPSPPTNIHTVLPCCRWVPASHRVPGPQLSSRLLQFHRTEVLGSASAKTMFPICSNVTEASLVTLFFSLHKRSYHCTEENVQILAVDISSPLNTIRSHSRGAEHLTLSSLMLLVSWSLPLCPPPSCTHSFLSFTTTCLPQHHCLNETMTDLGPIWQLCFLFFPAAAGSGISFPQHLMLIFQQGRSGQYFR